MQAPIATARFRLDDAHYRAVWQALRVRDPRRRLQGGMAWGLLLGGLATFPWWSTGGFVALMIATYLLTVREQERDQFFRRCRGQPGHGADVEVRFDDTGVTAVTPRSRLSAPWGTGMDATATYLVILDEGGYALHVPWSAVSPPDSVPSLRERLASAPTDAERAEVLEMRFDERVTLAMGLAAQVTGGGARIVLAAVLCDPESADSLEAEGFDLDVLEAAAVGRPEPRRDSVWAPPSEPLDESWDSFFEALPHVLDRPHGMPDVVAAARRMPELRPAFADARRAKPGRSPVGRVRLDNDDATPMEFVVDQLVTHAGCTRIGATRAMLRVHRAGSAQVRVPDPERVARAISEAARAAGHPLGIAPDV
ncbi:MAG: ATP-dependent Clp protease adaptor ClpS [Myxococcota bacterium]